MIFISKLLIEWLILPSKSSKSSSSLSSRSKNWFLQLVKALKIHEFYDKNLYFRSSFLQSLFVYQWNYFERSYYPIKHLTLLGVRQGITVVGYSLHFVSSSSSVEVHASEGEDIIEIHELKLASSSGGTDSNTAVSSDHHQKCCYLLICGPGMDGEFYLSSSIASSASSSSSSTSRSSSSSASASGSSSGKSFVTSLLAEGHCVWIIHSRGSKYSSSLNQLGEYSSFSSSTPTNSTATSSSSSSSSLYLKDLRRILSYIIEKEQFLPMILLGYSTGADLISAFINSAIGEDLLYLIKGVVLIVPINDYSSYREERNKKKEKDHRRRRKRNSQQNLTTTGKATATNQRKCGYFSSGWKGYFQSFALSLASYCHYIDLLIFLKDILQPSYYKRLMQFIYSLLLGIQSSSSIAKGREKRKESDAPVTDDNENDKEFWISFNHSQFLHSLIQWKAFLNFRKRRYTKQTIEDSSPSSVHSDLSLFSIHQPSHKVDKKTGDSFSGLVVCLYNENNEFYDVMSGLDSSLESLHDDCDLRNPFQLLSDQRVHDRINEFSLFLRYN
jgi:hypothetical protein